MPSENLGARLTVAVVGSFGVLHYPLLVFTTNVSLTSSESGEGQRYGSLTAALLNRGLRLACNADQADIALKAQQADGSIQCRASANGFISLVFDNRLVWSRQFDPKDAESVRWLKAAQSREVTLISGDHVQITETGIDLTLAADRKALVAAKIPTMWT